MRLSVLDQSPIRAGVTARTALNESVELARRADELGYERYWVAEHHGSHTFAGSAPEILVTRIASSTTRIRVGSGGVMLMHYSPYKVAESFKVLESLFPGRIDVGVGRAPGSDAMTAAALAYGSSIGMDYVPAKVGDLHAFLTDSQPVTPALVHVKAMPKTETVPQLWVLGSSDQSGMLAAHYGLPFSFAHFINAKECAQSLAVYRRNFRPNEWQPEPLVNIAVFALCADSEQEALDLAACRDLWRLRADKGSVGAYPSIAEARAYAYSTEERVQMDARRVRQLVGTPRVLRAKLQALADEFGVNELMILSITPEFRQRVRCYELLAEAFSLSA